MKKLMIALFAVACQMGIQAATINWNTGTVYAPGAGGTGYAEDSGYYIPVDGTGNYAIQLYVADAITGTSGNWALDPSHTFTFTSGDTASSINGDGYAEGTTVGGSYGPEGSKVNLAAGDYYAQMIITDLDSGNTLSTQVVKFTIDSLNNDTGTPTFGDGGAFIEALSGYTLDGEGGTGNYLGAWDTAGWQSVPEPTSGLLLLIGVAGLALRRRRA